MMVGVPRNIYFEEDSPLGVKIRTTKDYWQFIVREKHPSVAKHVAKIREAISNPHEIRRSAKRPNVFLHYRKIGKLYACAVAVHLNGEGFIITAYLTDRIKAGVQVWKRP